MHTLTVYNLGNADCCRIDLANGQKLLFDYANCRGKDDAGDLRANLEAELRRNLQAAKRASYDVVAFTHADKDHIVGASDFFYLEHGHGSFQAANVLTLRAGRAGNSAVVVDLLRRP